MHHSVDLIFWSELLFRCFKPIKIAETLRDALCLILILGWVIDVAYKPHNWDLNICYEERVDKTVRISCIH